MNVTRVMSVTSRIRSLLWKEWHEALPLLAIALFVFAGLPAIGALEDRSHRFFASLWALLLGGLLAAFVGVGVVARDLRGRLQEFWQSRPASVAGWLLVKFSVGLGVVLVALSAPLIVEIELNRGGDPAGANPLYVLTWHPFLWAACYGTAFATACLVRRGAQAAILSVAGLLLLYFLPEILPPVRFLSVAGVVQGSESPARDAANHLLPVYRQVPWMPWKVVYEPHQLLFALGMVGVCLAGLAVGVLAVRRDWRVGSGRGLVYWSVGGAVLVILSAAASRVGTNLPVLAVTDLPASELPASVRSDGSVGILATSDAGGDWRRNRVRPFRVTPAGIELGPAVLFEDDVRGFWTAEHPDLLYRPGLTPVHTREEETYPTLSVVNLKEPTAPARTVAFKDEALGPWSSAGWPSPKLYLWDHQLYWVGSSCLRFDLSDPSKPRLISRDPIDWRPAWTDPEGLGLRADQVGEPDEGTIALPVTRGLTPRQCLEAVVNGSPDQAYLTFSLDGDILTRAYGGRLTEYRLERLTAQSATFRKTGRYEPTPLEALYGLGNWGRPLTSGGLLFVILDKSSLEGAHLAVFDIRGPRPVPVGHFAAPNEPGFRTLCPLPDGRVLAAGQHRVYLLGPPPRNQ